MHSATTGARQRFCRYDGIYPATLKSGREEADMSAVLSSKMSLQCHDRLLFRLPDAEQPHRISITD